MFWKVMAGERLLCVIPAPTEEEAKAIAERMFPMLPVTVERDEHTRKGDIHEFSDR